MTSEARHHRRFSIRVSADVGWSGQSPITCVSRDLSLGGVGLESETSLPEQAQVELELFLVVDDIEDEATAPVALAGQVVWRRVLDSGAYLSGVEFRHPSPAQLRDLERLIKVVLALA